jgi:hypothetical protein
LASVEVSIERPVVGRDMEITLRFNFFDASRPGADFDPRYKLPKFETFSVAKVRRQKLCEVLATGDSAACNLAGVLSGCRKGHRCRSAACPVCARMFRVIWCGHLAQAVHASCCDWYAVNLVPPDLRFLRGQLHSFHPNVFKDRLRKQFERGKLGISRTAIVGGIDVALQIFEDPRRQPEWRPHAYFLVRGMAEGVIKAALREHYPADDDTRRPLRITQLDQTPLDAIKVATYSLKATFSARSPTTDSLGNDDTQKEFIPDDSWIELAPLLHRWGFDGRLIRRGSLSTFPLMKIR